MKKRPKVPKTRNAGKERRFWQRLDLSTHFEPGDFERASFPDLKPTSRPVSIRVPEYLLNRLKERANALNIPYQSLIKQYIKLGLISPL